MFKKISEASISRAILKEFAAWFDEYLKSDVIVVGAGPSGLVAARDLAKSGFKTLVIESNNYLGGGFWIGGFLMNTLTFRAPGQEILEELSISCKQVEEGLFVADGPNACSKLISAACDAGVKILNMVKFDDVVLKENKVEGVVINPFISNSAALVSRSFLDAFKSPFADAVPKITAMILRPFRWAVTALE